MKYRLTNLGSWPMTFKTLPAEMRGDIYSRLIQPVHTSVAFERPSDAPDDKKIHLTSCTLRLPASDDKSQAVILGENAYPDVNKGNPIYIKETDIQGILDDEISWMAQEAREHILKPNIVLLSYDHINKVIARQDTEYNRYKNYWAFQHYKYVFPTPSFIICNVTDLQVKVPGTASDINAQKLQDIQTCLSYDCFSIQSVRYSIETSGPACKVLLALFEFERGLFKIALRMRERLTVYLKMEMENCQDQVPVVYDEVMAFSAFREVLDKIHTTWKGAGMKTARNRCRVHGKRWER